MILVDDKHALMDERELRDLPEYSTTLPTGTTIGKRWKCNRLAYALRDPRDGKTYFDRILDPLQARTRDAP